MTTLSSQIQARPADWLVSLGAAQARLPPADEGLRYCQLFSHGTMNLELYSPVHEDRQIPHRQDELYIVASGSGDFIKNGERRSFRTHDVIFVEAGAEHRFVDFTDDFSAWVVFWGPDGGEDGQLRG